MEAFGIEENTLSKLRIIVIGIGASGNNVVEYIRNKNMQGLELISTNGYELDRYTALHEQLKGADIIFIVVGLGDTIGITSVPSIAKMAQGTGALTIAIVEDTLKQLQCECDSTIVISNGNLLDIMDTKHKIKDGFQVVDVIYANVIQAISEIVIGSGDNDITLDLIDLKTVMSDRSDAVIGIGEYKGEDAAYEAMKSAISFPLMQSTALNKASGVVVHFNLHPEYDFMKLSNAMELIHHSIDESANVIFGTITDEDLPTDFVRITIIATGMPMPMKACNNAL